MKTVRTLPLEFTFAGFNFPRYIASLPEQLSPRCWAASLETMWGMRNAALKAVLREHAGGTHYHAPKPNARHRGFGFYLDEDNAAGLRIVDSECGSYTDHDTDTTINGLVARLPKGRGYLAGWTMGVNMASSLDAHVFDELTAAETAAQNLAESACWEQAMHQRNEQAAQAIDTEIADKLDELAEVRNSHSAHVIAATYSRGPSVQRRKDQCAKLRADACLIIHRIRVLRERHADNFARTGV